MPEQSQTLFPVLWAIQGYSEKVGAVAYKLDLPASAQIHPVVHVSLLKRHIPSTTPVSPDLSSVATDETVPTSPLLVLDRQLRLRGGSAVPQIMVRWDSVSQLQTWEDENDLRRRFPTAPAWGQAASKAAGSVMTSAPLVG